MEIIHLFLTNFLSPMVLFFILGVLAGWMKSDLEVPEAISHYLSLYLILSIGFKGGVSVAQQPVDLVMAQTTLAGLAAGFFLPFIAYRLLRWTTRLDVNNAAAVAAHYGSISMVTFVTATTLLRHQGISYAGYIVAVLALMEAPAIFAGLFIARNAHPDHTGGMFSSKLLREVFSNGAIFLMLGAFIIGALTGDAGMEKMRGFVVDPFNGILSLFLLDMGILVAKELHRLRDFTWSLVLFGIYMPLLGAGLGIGIAQAIGMDVGTGTLFVVLMASASYIAVPAALKIALPEASPAIYLPMSIGITFPFNVMLGIPLYYALAQKILG